MAQRGSHVEFVRTQRSHGWRSEGAMSMYLRGPAIAVLAIVLVGCSSSKHTSSGASPTTKIGASSSSANPTRNAPTTSVTVASNAPLQIATAPWQLPEGRAREVVLAGDHALYVVGGLNPGKSSTARVWHVALPAGTTTRLAVLPIAVHDASGAWFPPSVFVFGGGNATEVSAVQRYQAGAATVVAHLPEPRSDTAAITINDTAYVLGGYDGSAEPAAVLATSDGVTFRTVAQLAQTVRYAAVAEVAGRIYLFGGEHHGTTVSTVQTIDPGPGAARIAGQLPMPITEATAVVVDDEILLIGGRSGGRTLDTVQKYNPATGTLTVVGHLPYPVADAGSAVVDGVAYVVGGETPAVTAGVITLRHA